MAALNGYWTFVACDGLGNALCELSTAQGKTLPFVRNGAAECSFSLSHDDDACALILAALITGPNAPTVKGWRTDITGAKVLRFNGYLAGISEESGVDASTATFTFRGPFGRLVGEETARGRFTAASVAFTATDAGTITQTLIDTANAQAFTGIATSGTITPSKVRDRAYQYANIGEAITNLTNVLDGFDFEIVPVDSGTTMGVLNIYAAQGQSRPSAKFEYGPDTLANCSAVHRQTLPPINVARVLGANGLVGEKTDTASLAARGRWEWQESAGDVSEQTTLDDKALALLRPNPVKVIDFTPDPTLAPSPWDDFWLGDTVPFYANRGALVESLSVRVNAITIVVDDDTGRETVAVPDPTTPDEEATIRAKMSVEVV